MKKIYLEKFYLIKYNQININNETMQCFRCQSCSDKKISFFLTDDFYDFHFKI